MNAAYLIHENLSLPNYCFTVLNICTAIGKEELMHECCPHHLCTGTQKKRHRDRRRQAKESIWKKKRTQKIVQRPSYSSGLPSLG